MSQGNDDIWTPPVNFYFNVVFQWGTQNATASFMEVSGLAQELVIKTIQPLGDDGGQTLVTGEINHEKIVLKRPLEPVGETIAGWVKECFSFMVGQNKIRPCLLIISLLNSEGNPFASWECTQAFPVKWGINPLNSNKSELSIETLTLTCKTLVRKE